MKRRLFFTVILIFSILLAVELIARAYYYRKPARNSLATFELVSAVYRKIFDQAQVKRIRNEAHYFFRPQFTKQQNDSIVAEMNSINFAVYQPWVAFSFGNYHGKYVNASNQIRLSVPETSKESSNPKIVWFLGGSTTFGFNVTDSETIPSAFVREYSKVSQESIKVINYGVPYYYSYHELILLSDQLFRGNKPDIVIMLDGLNECGAPSASIFRNPYNTPDMQKLFNPDMYSYPKGFTYSDFVDSTQVEKGSQTIVQNYLQNIQHVKHLADQYGFKLYCFWQPVPYYNYDRTADPFCAKKMKKQFEFVYPSIKEKDKEVDYLYYLGDMIQNEKLPFIDSVHYSPRMNQLIAKRILDSVFDKF
jgi:lysophospholipase L1-like esterase